VAGWRIFGDVSSVTDVAGLMRSQRIHRVLPVA
jgi:hypothetical protein